MIQRRAIKRNWITRIVWIAVIAVIWEITARLNIFPNLLFPSLGEVLSSFSRSLLEGLLFIQTGFSLLLIVLGIAASLVLALLFFILSISSARAKDFLLLLQSILHPLPGIALLPLFILWFGTGTAPVFAVILHAVVWPLFTSIMGGYDSIPELWRRVGINYRLGKRSMMFHIYIPGSMPSLVSGLKIGWARSWRALISAEMIFGAIGKTGGIGWFLFQKRVFMDTPGLFAGLLMVAVIGLLVEYSVFRLLEKSTIKKWGMTA